MKKCQSCNIEVGGNFSYCPLCQNELVGEQEERYFPPIKEKKAQSLFYKIQLFFSLAVLILCISLDYMMELHGGLHWSIITTAWIIVLQLTIRQLMRKHSAAVYFVSYISLAIAVVLLVSAYYLNYMTFCLQYILPSICMYVLVVLFLFCLLDKKGNVMVYLLVTILISIAPNVVLLLHHKKPPILWSICFVVGAISLLGLIVFTGSKVFNEIHKRLHI